MSGFRVRDVRKGEWYFIDNALLRGGWGKKLGPYGIAVYNAIVLHASADEQSAYPSHDTIAELTGMSRPTVWKFVQMLADWNIISIERKEGQSHTYYLVDRSEWIPVKDVNTPRPVKEVYTPCKPDLQPPVNEVYTNKTHITTLRDKTQESASAHPPPTSKKKRQKKPTPEAVKVFRENVHRYPAKSWYDAVETIVGDDPDDLKRWGELCHEWVGRGYNPVNVSGMLDCYQNGGISNGGGRANNLDATIAAAEAFLEEIGEDGDSG